MTPDQEQAIAIGVVLMAICFTVAVIVYRRAAERELREQYKKVIYGPPPQASDDVTYTAGTLLETGYGQGYEKTNTHLEITPEGALKEVVNT